jgi:UDP-N-acetylglucosamine:LPS N-acetylglucosamine transferase
LTGGGSGGHITPLLSLARALKEQNPNCNIVYIGHKGDKFDNMKNVTMILILLLLLMAANSAAITAKATKPHLLDFKTIRFKYPRLFQGFWAVS